MLLHANGVMVSHLFLAMVIGARTLSIAVAVVLGTIVLQMETKMAPTTKTVVKTNETRHGMLSTPPSDSRPR